MEKRFLDIVELIRRSRNNAIRAVNTELINLYWNVGGYIKHKLSTAEWGDKTVSELADFIQKNNPELKGFNLKSLYRMVQFYESYVSSPIVATLWRQLQHIDKEESAVSPTSGKEFKNQDIRNTILCQLSWSHHRTIFGRCKSEEEREFYIRMTIKENYSVRELDRQISASLFERMVIGNQQPIPPKSNSHPDISKTFKDSYIFEFLNLPDSYNESDLQKGLIKQMRDFILELGKDFLFVGDEYKIQVGKSDFYIDLLFYHRELQCLIAFELKADNFKPEHLGKLNFYLEALDRDVKKKNENPSIGILLCKDRDNEVVEYALNRTLSPTLISKYHTQLPDKKLLQQKLHELFENRTS
jgi:predicted nuclease of restriction endonuclease-like (RecB) superfamily